MKVSLVVIALAAAAALSACSTIFGPSPEPIVKNAPPIEPVSPDDYRLGAGDYIEISIEGDPEMSGTYTRTVMVLPDGTINYLWNEITGRFYVEGKTADEVAEMIQKKLIVKEKIQPGGKVSVLPTTVRSPIVYVMGEVEIPGAQGAIVPITITRAIAMAGGFTDYADKRRIQLVRREGKREWRYYFNYKYWVEHPGSDKYVDRQLLPGDMVIVPEN